MNQEELEKATNLIKYLCDQKESVYFANPVDFRAMGLNDYPYIIKSPMDFSTIKTRLDQCFYASFDEFLRDIILIWDNTRVYHLPDSEIVAKVEIMEKAMVRFGNINHISFENAVKNPKIEENYEFVQFQERIQLSELMKTLTSKRLALLVDVIETECPQAISYMKDEVVQIRIDALDKSTFFRVKEMAILDNPESKKNFVKSNDNFESEENKRI